MREGRLKELFAPWRDPLSTYEDPKTDRVRVISAKKHTRKRKKAKPHRDKNAAWV